MKPHRQVYRTWLTLRQVFAKVSFTKFIHADYIQTRKRIRKWEAS